MRLLFLTDRLPYPLHGGSAIRIWSLLRALASEHQVELACLGAPDRPVPPPLAETCSRVTVVDPPQTPRGNEILAAYFASRSSPLPWGLQERRTDRMSRLVAERSAEADAVVAVQLGMSQYLDEVRGSALRVYDAHDLEHSNLEQFEHLGGNPLRRLYAASEAQRVKRYESGLLERTDLVTVVTDQLAAGLRRLHAQVHVRTVPIGIVLQDYPCLRQAGPQKICFTGDMAWPPNVDGAFHLCREVLPLLRRRGLDVPVVLAGKNPVPEVRALEAADVQVTSFVPSMDQALRGDSVAVAPLRAGSGMRVKILEAMAWGLPVLSTALGCEGIDHAGTLLEAEGAEAWAAALEQLFGDGRLRAELGRAGRQRVSELYGHEATSRRFVDALAELV